MSSTTFDPDALKLSEEDLKASADREALIAQQHDEYDRTSGRGARLRRETREAATRGECPCGGVLVGGVCGPCENEEADAAGTRCTTCGAICGDRTCDDCRAIERELADDEEFG